MPSCSKRRCIACQEQAEQIERLRKRALKENRADDAREEVIRRRWRVYQEETRPVLEHYPSSIIRTVDAMGSPASVLQHILEMVVPVQESHFKNRLDV